MCEGYWGGFDYLPDETDRAPRGQKQKSVKKKHAKAAARAARQSITTAAPRFTPRPPVV